MATNLDRHESDLAALLQLGNDMMSDLAARHDIGLHDIDVFEEQYQRWYTESLAVIRQLIPDRLADFRAYYEPAKSRKVAEAHSYTIHDWMMGTRDITIRDRALLRHDTLYSTIRLFSNQLDILASAKQRLKSSLFEIRKLVQADLFDSDLDAATSLLEHGFARAAGAIAGVVLERHLAQVASDHSLKTGKKHPTIATWYDLLKEGGVIDVAEWRRIQHFGDLRNKCDHPGDGEPTESDIRELIEGAKRTIKTLA